MLLIDPTTGAVFGQSGGPQVVITDNQAARATGQSFHAGLVTLAIDTVGGPVVTTTTADTSGHFTVDFDTNPGIFPPGSHNLVAWQTINGTPTFETSIALNVEHIQ
jgi:hypothetical protein